MHTWLESQCPRCVFPAGLPQCWAAVSHPDRHCLRKEQGERQVVLLWRQQRLGGFRRPNSGEYLAWGCSRSELRVWFPALGVTLQPSCVDGFRRVFFLFGRQKLRMCCSISAETARNILPPLLPKKSVMAWTPTEHHLQRSVTMAVVALVKQCLRRFFFLL